MGRGNAPRVPAPQHGSQPFCQLLLFPKLAAVFPKLALIAKSVDKAKMSELCHKISAGAGGEEGFVRHLSVAEVYSNDGPRAPRGATETRHCDLVVWLRRAAIVAGGHSPIHEAWGACLYTASR